MNPSTAQHAALKILLEDVEPLLQKAEVISASLSTAQQAMHGELETFGAMVRSANALQPSLVEASQRLAATASRLEAVQESTPHRFAEDRPRSRRMPTLIACLLSAVLGTALSACAMLWVSHDMWEQARIGRALQSAWPALDTVTRSKVQQHLGN